MAIGLRRTSKKNHRKVAKSAKEKKLFLYDLCDFATLR
jgi:hypothetical protein